MRCAMSFQSRAIIEEHDEIQSCQLKGDICQVCTMMFTTVNCEQYHNNKSGAFQPCGTEHFRKSDELPRLGRYVSLHAFGGFVLQTIGVGDELSRKEDLSLPNDVNMEISIV